MADRVTVEQRSWNMSQIKGMNTSIEKLVRRSAYCRGLRYRTHVMNLPGRPDMVFPGAGVVVFIDGDFWHGWQFTRWCSRLSPIWKSKIERNRKRDKRNYANLRRAGWTVIRIWEHEVHRDLDECVDRISRALNARRKLQLSLERDTCNLSRRVKFKRAQTEVRNCHSL